MAASIAFWSLLVVALIGAISGAVVPEEEIYDVEKVALESWKNGQDDELVLIDVPEGDDDDNHTRIILGSEVAMNQYPFAVSMQYDPKLYRDGKFCGGSIIGKQWVLSAAHCFMSRPPPADIYAKAGTLNAHEYGGTSQMRLVTRTHNHPAFNHAELINDISLVRLAQPFEWTASVHPIRLALPDHDAESIGFGVIMGWGATEPVHHRYPSNVLLYTDVSVVPLQSCARYFNVRVSTHQVCVASTKRGSGSCQGDSGGPFIQWVGNNPVLEGLTSYSINTCAVVPTVYTRVSKYYNWIMQTAAANNY